MKVFIYGTLKRGFPLFEKGLHGARYLGDVETIELYPMYIAGSFYGPMMLDRPGEGLQVRGELFEVEEGRLQTFDELEAVGQEGSFRSTVDVAPVGGGVPTTAYRLHEIRKVARPAPLGPPQRLSGQAVRPAMGPIVRIARRFPQPRRKFSS